MYNDVKMIWLLQKTDGIMTLSSLRGKKRKADKMAVKVLNKYFY